MGFKKLVSMTIAVVGDTATGHMYAEGFARAGHEILMATPGKDCFDLPDALSLFENIETCSISAAASLADLIVLATTPRHVREASYWMEDVRKKVIIDATANEHVADSELVKTVCAIKAITGSPHVVKAFNTAGYEHILRPLFNGATVDMILLSDSLKAKEIAKIMGIELGLNSFYDFGGSENISIFNEMTRCWRNLKLTSPVPVQLTRL